MTTEMTIVFTLLAIFCAGVMGLVRWRIQAFYLFALIFLNFVWGIWLGLKISESNQLIWFGTPLVTLAVVALVAKHFIPKLWTIINDERNLR